MNFKNIAVALLLIITVLASCKKEEYQLAGDIVINELMPVNSSVAEDQDGEFDDWIELANSTSLSVDISGYYLSDNSSKLLKWQFPQGSIIEANSYLIIWADKDTTQVGLHTNFKLSSLGEVVILSDNEGTIIDEIVYPAQALELSYSRQPDKAGPFKWKSPTFNKSNDSSK